MNGMKKRRVLLTGATGGIGRALASQLAGCVDRLVLTGRDAKALRELNTQHGGHVETVCCDLADPEAALALATSAGRDRDGIDTLIHCAGTSDFGAFAASDTAAIDRIIDLNLTAPIRLTRELLPAMLGQPRPMLVFVGSALGRLGYPGQAVYCASKAGLHRFAEALRREYADRGLQVIHVAPRATATGFNNAAQQAVNRELKVAEDTPEFVAAHIVDAIKRGRSDTIIGFPEKLATRLNQITPGLFDRVLRSHAAAVCRQTSQPPNQRNKP